MMISSFGCPFYTDTIQAVQKVQPARDDSPSFHCLKCSFMKFSTRVKTDNDWNYFIF